MKKYNPHKRSQQKQQQQFDKALPQLAVVQVFGDKLSYLWHRQQKELITPTQQVATRLFTNKYLWNIACIVAARTPQGESWYRVWDVSPDIHATQPSINQDCQEKHIKLLKTVPKAQRLNGAWIGTPSGEILPQNELDEILDAVKIFDFISEHEYQQQQAHHET